MDRREWFMSFLLRVIALALAIACIVLGLMENATNETLAVLLGVGIVALALAGMRRNRTT
jgi:hypothetical protein